MKKSYAMFLITMLIAALGVLAEGKPPLRLIRSIPMPGFEGCDFDHFDYDLKGNRLFLAAEDHNTVEVFDLRSGKPLRSIKGFNHPHGIVFLPDSNKFIVTDGGSDFGKANIVSGDKYEVVDTIKLPPGADNAVYDPARKYCYVENRGTDPSGNSNLLSIIDTKTFKHIGDITLPGRNSQAMAIEHSGKRLFINLAATNEVGVVDLQTHQLVAKWSVPEASAQ